MVLPVKMDISNLGLSLVKHFESCFLKAYLDTSKIWTIGFGATGPDIKEGLVITQEQADKMLKEDMAENMKYVNYYVNQPLTQYQFDALVSFCFNLGVGTLSKSDLLKYVNVGKFTEASNEFTKFCRSRKVPTPGLFRRRLSEKTMFTTGKLDVHMTDYKQFMKTDPNWPKA